MIPSLPPVYGMAGAGVFAVLAVIQTPIWMSLTGSLMATFGTVFVAYYRYKTNATITELQEEVRILKREALVRRIREDRNRPPGN